MRKRILSFFTVLAILCTAVSCTKDPPESDSTSDAQTTNTEQLRDDMFFIIHDGIQYEDGRYRYLNGDTDAVLLSSEKFPAAKTFDFTLRFSSTSGRLQILFDVKTDEAGALSSAHILQIDSLGGSLSLNETDEGTNRQMASVHYSFEKDVDYQISFRNRAKTISVYIGKETAEDSPVIDISCSRPTSAPIALSFSGNSKVSVSTPTISDTVLPNKDARYANPLLPDTEIADPTILYYEGCYYLLSTGSFVCRTSTDLVNWTKAGEIASKNDLYGCKYFGGATIFERNGIFYLFYTSHQSETSGLSIFYATSDNVLGPYQQSGSMQEHVVLSGNSPAGSFLFRDPVSEKDILFFYRTDPGVGNVVYGIRVEVGNGKITLTDRNPVKLVTPTESWERKNENGESLPVCERPNVIYRNGYYYLFYAGSHYKTSYSEGYAVSDSPLSGFVKPKASNPVLDATSSLTGVGCTWIVPSPDGSELWVAYHCHNSLSSIHPRRLCIDKLTFRESSDGGPDIPVIHGPTVTYQPAPSNKK